MTYVASSPAAGSGNTLASGGDLKPYILSSQESLASVASRTGLSQQQLLAINPHSAIPELIGPGDTLIVPASVMDSWDDGLVDTHLQSAIASETSTEPTVVVTPDPELPPDPWPGPGSPPIDPGPGPEPGDPGGGGGIGDGADPGAHGRTIQVLLDDGAFLAFDQHLQGVVRQADHLLDDAERTDPVQVIAFGVIYARFFLDQQQNPVVRGLCFLKRALGLRSSDLHIVVIPWQHNYSAQRDYRQFPFHAHS